MPDPRGEEAPSCGPCEDRALRATGRKSSKPLAEKRRRARINASLAQLKCLIMDANKRQSQRYSRLEKADILELTVRRVQSIQRRTAQEYEALTKVGTFCSGFRECAKDLIGFLSSRETFYPEICRILQDYLGGSVMSLDTPALTEAPFLTQDQRPARIEREPIAPVGKNRMDITVDSDRATLADPLIKTSIPLTAPTYNHSIPSTFEPIVSFSLQEAENPPSATIMQSGMSHTQASLPPRLPILTPPNCFNGDPNMLLRESPVFYAPVPKFRTTSEGCSMDCVWRPW
ncbi:hypothetical protein NDU88_000211 [Pleurodeles waltl]|uniref:BHLH domain-containing protein n=1 Tax=Pleurodeles waltl TaxID=8319 RepID=A0AAV7KNX5_PLEWA|nr:hypothetical protein NDU88_000211 [Pleurodeles waltl]